MFYEAQREGRPSRLQSAVIRRMERADGDTTWAGQATESTSYD